jgi:hypothetical protein
VVQNPDGDADLHSALPAAAAPVAWRYRYGPTGMWKYANTRDDVNPGSEYEVEPLYSAPLTNEQPGTYARD